MRNKLFWALAATVSVVVALLVWGAVAGLRDLGLTDPVAAVCSLAFLFVAFVAWEYLMKPGYGWMHRRQDVEPDASEEGADETPPSPGPP